MKTFIRFDEDWLNKFGSGSTITDIFITSTIINSNPQIKTFYEFGAWVGGNMILINLKTNGLKFYASETMEHFNDIGIKNVHDKIDYERITDLRSLEEYIKEKSLSGIDLTMFRTNQEVLETVPELLDFVHLDCLVDGDHVHNTITEIIDKKMSKFGILCVDDFAPLCAFRSFAVSKLVIEGRLFPIFTGLRKMFFCTSEEQRDIYVDLITRYSATDEAKRMFAGLFKGNGFKPINLSLGGIQYPHFKYDPRQ